MDDTFAIRELRAEQAVRSILAADCGSTFTRVLLLEQIEAGFCFVAQAAAPTTAEPPWSDVSIGVRHAIEQISATTGRLLLDEHGFLVLPEARGQGVDLFVVTASAGQPLKVVLAGLVSQVSLASLERAAASSFVSVLGVIAKDDSRILAQPSVGGIEMSDEDKIAFIRQHHPDVVCIAGGTNGGSREPVRNLVEALVLACTLVDSPPQPTIIYAGNTDLRSDIVEMVGEDVSLKVVENVRPALNAENLAAVRDAFQAAYIQRKVQHLPGMSTLIGWSSAPVLPTPEAQEYLVMYLERLYESGKGVLCADVGSASTTIAASFPPAWALATGELHAPQPKEGGHPDPLRSLHVATDVGVGYGAPALLERVGAPAIARWLPFEPHPGEIAQVLLNKGVHPHTIPSTRRELLIEQAAAREALRLVMARARQSWRTELPITAIGSRQWPMPLLEPLIACGGVLSQAPRPGQTLLMLLDAVEPVGVTTVVLDKYGLASTLGAVAVAQPLAAVQALDAGAFRNLGTVIAPAGRAHPGDVIMRVKITFEQGGQLEIEVKYGSIEVLPLRPGEKAKLEMKPRRGMWVGRSGGSVEVHGGEVGLVIDARGRPLRLLTDPGACRQQIQQWLWDMGV